MCYWTLIERKSRAIPYIGPVQEAEQIVNYAEGASHNLAVQDYVNGTPAVSKITSIRTYVIDHFAASPVHNFCGGFVKPWFSARRNYLPRITRRTASVAWYSSCVRAVFFREVLSDCLFLCPIARANAAEKVINLGGLLWHGQTRYSRSAFDNSSFVTTKELKKAASEYIGFKLQEAVFETLLTEFEKVCHLRHSIVHGDGILPGKNAVQLEIPSQMMPLKVVIRYDQLQETASVLTTLVATFNRELFALMCQRWAIDWRKRSDWDEAKERQSYRSDMVDFFREGRAKKTR